MADAMQGIMGLPQAPTTQNNASGETLDPSLFSPVIESYARNNPVEFGNDMLNSMDAVDPSLVQKFKGYLSRVKLPVEVLDAMGQLVDLVLGNPDRYDEIRADLLKEGVPEELLPEEFDMAFFAALNIALDQLEASRPQETLEMAKGGIATLKPLHAEMAKMAGMGRREDKMLAHITPGEARMLRRRGGRGSINPATGLPEFGFFSSIGKAIGGVFKGIGDAVSGIVKGVGKLVKEVASSTIGKIVLTAAAVYFLGPAGLNLAGTAGSITGLTGSLAVGVNTFAASTLVGLASGQNLGQALKTGAISGVTAGFGSAIFGTPAGYEGGTQTPAPVVDKSFPAGGTPPGAVPGQGSVVTDTGTAQTFAVPEVPKLTPTSLATTPETALQDATAVARAPVTAVTAPSEVVPGTVQGATSVTAPAVTAPQPAATFLRPEAGLNTSVPTGEFGRINMQGYSGEGLKIPGISRTVEQVGIESLAPRVASTAGTAANAAAPGFWDSLKQGNLVDAAKAAYSNISPSEIQKQGVTGAIDSVKQQFPGVTTEQIINAPAGSVLAQAYKAAQPGLLATYGPMALTGLAAMGAMGGFKKEQPEPPPGFSGPTGIDLLKSDPKTYGLSYGGTRTSYALNPYDYMYSLPPMKAATGGIASLDRYAGGGQPSHFPRKTGPINGPGTGTSDSIPAMLSDGEFVFTAKAVRGAGNGSRRAGAKRMYALMKALERKA